MSLSTTTAVFAVVLAIALGGCGSRETGDPSSANEPLEIWFRTLYSAHIPDHDFKVPAVVDGVKPERWEVVPADGALLEPDPETHSVMITPLRAGKFEVIAHADERMGSVDLFVAEGNPDLLKRGELRYNNGVIVQLADLLAGQVAPNAACTNCHGSNAALLRIEHTPRQTGGYSDEELIRIIAFGEKPLGALDAGSFPFEPGLTMIHRWAATQEDYLGLVLYLRSLAPAAQRASQVMAQEPATGGAAGSGEM